MSESAILPIYPMGSRQEVPGGDGARAFISQQLQAARM
jgi:hypothetical protein